MLLGITAGKRTRSCSPISQNRSKISALPLGPANLFNPAFLCREKEDEGERRNTYLFLRGKTNWQKYCPPGGTAFPCKGRSCKILFCDLKNAFLPCSHPARSAGIFSFSPTHSLFFTAWKNSFFSLVRAFTTCCHPTFHLYFKWVPTSFNWAKYSSFPC